MVKIAISNVDLVWVFTEKLKSFRDDAPAISIAIVPDKDGWVRYREPERPQSPPSLRQAYRAGSKRTSRELRFGEGLIPAALSMARSASWIAATLNL
jgi:hypothetical protein